VLFRSDGLSIRALGTSFDVSSYDDDKQIISSLVEGSIALIGLNGQEVTRIHPGQQAILYKATNILGIRDADILLTTSWKDGTLIFRNTSLTDVTVQLERWFNCKIHLDTRLINSDLKYTATIQNETLGEVLKMIEISTRIKTKIEKREVYINSRN
jgi:transmembrane sensor